MVSERWQQIEALFHAALERDEGARTAFLQEACAGDEGLLREVEKLVRSHQPAQGAIRTEAVREAVQEFAGAGAPLEDGSQLGAYRVLHEIGRGGMGTVFLAERSDQQFEKRVAIKVIRRGMDSASVLRHFRNERQILASLDHPNVARLIDGGTTGDGLPYFVMEYIEGQPIDAYCAERDLPVAERLELFRKVCAAVSYAHQQLVIHRDIKPSNILVTADGTPKLLDFGIARLFEPDAEPSETLTGTMLMTPEYASPEQARGQHATTLTDVYSLGVVLYELLAGVSPYRSTNHSPLELVEGICRVEPPKPSDAVARDTNLERLRRRLRGDLDNIVLTALRKDPQRRYASVERLSDDIRRHLEALPITARPDTWSYRTAKFVRRNRVGVAATVAACVALVGGAGAATWQARIARHEQARAERRFQEVRNLAHTVLFDYHDSIKNLPGATPVRERLVRDALQYLDSLASESIGDPSLQRELAAAYERVADVQGGTMSANLGDTAGAITSSTKALKIREALLAADAKVIETRRDVAASYHNLGSLLWETGDISTAAEYLRRSLKLRDGLATADPSNIALQYDLGATHDRLGMILLEQGDAAGSLENHRGYLEILTALPKFEQDREETRRRLSVAHEHIGSALVQTNHLPGALESNRRALAIRAALARDYPLNADYQRILLVSYYNDGEILSAMGRTEEALSSYRKDLSIAGKLFAADPKNEQYRGDLAYALVREGDMLVKRADYTSALASYRRSETFRAADVKVDASNLWKRSSLIEARVKICKALAMAKQTSDAVSHCAATAQFVAETQVDPANAAIRGFFADTYADLGEASAALAQQNLAGGNIASAHWQRAKEMYERSSVIWEDMRQRGIMSKVDEGKPGAVKQNLAKCEAALSTLVP